MFDVLATRSGAHGAAGGGVELAAAEGHGVEGVVEDEVELVVGELGLHEGVVAIVGPGGVGDVEDQGGFLGGVAAEEGLRDGVSMMEREEGLFRRIGGDLPGTC